ncbi:MAG: DUF2322 family protein [Methylophilaceae bacterium]|nr:DUF2322 family protein [Methylophilaceae bacterium]
MKNFAATLATLESADHLDRLELHAPDGSWVATIENRPGSQGSLKVYHHLWKRYGAITVEAAREGLMLYAEHTADARAHPGKHPNIDRLLALVERGGRLEVRAFP